jgi:hypothetical protein
MLLLSSAESRAAGVYCTGDDGHIWEVLTVSYVGRESGAPVGPAASSHSAGTRTPTAPTAQNFLYTGQVQHVKDSTSGRSPPSTARLSRYPPVGGIPKRCAGILQIVHRLPEAL